MTDIFDNGHVDHAIFNPAALNDFYVNGFSRPLAFDMAQRNPGPARVGPDEGGAASECRGQH